MLVPGTTGVTVPGTPVSVTVAGVVVVVKSLVGGLGSLGYTTSLGTEREGVLLWRPK